MGAGKGKSRRAQTAQSSLRQILKSFEYEIQQINSGELKLHSSLDDGTGIERGVIALLDTILEKADTKLKFNVSQRETAARLERNARQKGDKTLAGILRVYNDIVRVYPDVLGARYGGTPSDFDEFRRYTITRLLKAASAWAEQHDEKVAQDINLVQTSWSQCVGAAEEELD
jgi:exonuclease VII small subunit